MDEVTGIVLSVGQQNAASIQNIGGHPTIEGGIHTEATWETIELRRTITRAQEEVARLDEEVGLDATRICASLGFTLIELAPSYSADLHDADLAVTRWTLVALEAPPGLDVG